MTDPSVSVVIPVAAGAGSLSSCLESVLAQSYEKKEVVVVCRAGEAPAALKKATDVRVVTASEGAGLAHLINAGFRAARGEIKVLLMPHCTPVGDRWIEELLRPFDDETVEVVVSQCNLTRRDRQGLPARLLRSVVRPELKNRGGQPAELDVVSHLADAYRASALEELGYLDEGFVSPGEAIDISVRLTLAGHRIVLSPTAMVLCHDPPESRSFSGVFRKALDYGHCDAVLAKTYNVDWLSSRVYAAALFSLLLLPVGLAKLPVAVILAGMLFAWGWFLPLRLPVLRWEWPVAVLNLVVYAGIILAIRDEWAPGVFAPRRSHPAIIRQWCILGAMTFSYALMLVSVGLRSAVRTLVRDRSFLAALLIFPLSMVWWLVTGVGFLRGYLLGRREQP